MSRKTYAKNRKEYECPLGHRYGKDMGSIFSDEFRFTTWRKCWLALASAEHDLGLAGVTQEQVDELAAHIDDLDFDCAEERERIVRHDLMAHVYAYGQAAPKAAGIIHAGATSCDIKDNAELIQIYAGLDLVQHKLVSTIRLLSRFAKEHRDLSILGLTHMQPAQPTTLGKRVSLWLQDLIMDYQKLCHLTKDKRLRGLKGATGTQASFLSLAAGDVSKVEELNRRFIRNLGFDNDFAVCGQTYTRKFDSSVLSVLAGIAESAHKAGTDIRLMQARMEMEEPFENDQIGSSAMAYKRNPMRCERMCSLAREVIGNLPKAHMTAMVQWFERTLDDSAGRRLYIPESFIAIDEVLNIYMNIMEAPLVNKAVIARNLDEMLPFMASENIMMAAVKNGSDRQEVHELIRQHSMEAARIMKQEGRPNGLLRMLADDPGFPLDESQIMGSIDIRELTGMASCQVDVFLRDVDRMLKREKRILPSRSALSV